MASTGSTTGQQGGTTVTPIHTTASLTNSLPVPPFICTLTPPERDSQHQLSQEDLVRPFQSLNLNQGETFERSATAAEHFHNSNETNNKNLSTNEFPKIPNNKDSKKK